MNEKLAEIHFRKAENYRSQGNNEEAISNFVKVIDFAETVNPPPTHWFVWSAHMQLSELYRNMEKFDESNDVLSKAELYA